MRKFLLIAAAAFTLNACVPSTGDPRVDAFLNQVQAIAKGICGIEIQAATLIGIGSGFTSPAAVATMLCNQVVNFARRRGIRFGGGVTITVPVRISGYVVAVTVRR